MKKTPVRSTSATLIQEIRENIQGIPNWLLVDDCGRTRDDDSNEGRKGKSAGNGDELTPEGVPWLPRKTSKVRIVDYTMSASP